MQCNKKVEMLMLWKKSNCKGCLLCISNKYIDDWKLRRKNI